MIHRKISWKIGKHEPLMILLLFLSVHVNSIAFITGFESIYKRTPLAIIIVLCIVSAVEKHRFSTAFKISAAYFTLFAFSTLLHNRGEFLPFIYAISPCMSVLFLTEYYINRNPYEYLHAILILTSALTIIDLITIVAYPNGMYDSGWYTSNWFLGYKTERVRLAGMAMIMTSAILQMKKNSKLDISFIVVSLLAIIDSWAAGGDAGTFVLIFMVSFLLVMNVSSLVGLKKIAIKIFSLKTMIVVIVIINMMVISMQSFGPVVNLLSNLFGKDSTLSGRTIIWMNSMKFFFNYPMLGNGFISGDAFQMISGVKGGATPHNLYIGLLVYSGVFGFAVYMMNVYRTFHRLNVRELSPILVCAIFIICNLIMGTTSFNLYGQFNFASFVIFERLIYLDNQQQQKFIHRDAGRYLNEGAVCKFSSDGA